MAREISARIGSGLIVALVVGIGSASAHVPYLERRDYSEQAPFQVRGSIEQSIAVYSWIEFQGWQPAVDVDYYRFELSAPAELFGQALVPVCPGYEQLLPWFAIVGPGLPPPAVELPFQLPDGDGAIVVPNLAPGETRPVFYEPFGGKWYYDGPTFEATLTVPGTYYAVFWDPLQLGGDYVAVLGDQEIWKLPDILRALVNTPIIRKNGELHTECPD